MVKVVGGLVNHGGEYQRIFLEESTNRLMFDNEPMGYCVVEFDSATAPKFDPIELSNTDYAQEEEDLVNLLRMYTPTYRGIVRLQNNQSILIKDYSPMDASILSAEEGIKPVSLDCITHEIDEDDEEALDLAYHVITLKEAGY